MLSVYYTIQMAGLFVVGVVIGHHCQHQTHSITELRYAKIDVTGSDKVLRSMKRDSEPRFEPIRILPFYDNTVNSLTAEQQRILKKDVIGHVMEYFQRAIRVRPIEDTILLERQCDINVPLPGDYCPRLAGCAAVSKCGLAAIPEEHLAACEVCDIGGTNCGPIGQNGTGVENTDYILYVSADVQASSCADPEGLVLAFSSACQLEEEYDRPVAGVMNICVNRAFDVEITTLKGVVMHEIIHALAFSPVLYALFRDENGLPRTTRDPNTGLPKVSSEGWFIPDDTTLTEKMVKRTTIPMGTFSYPVPMLVTPALMREGKKFFGCDTFPGIPLEDIEKKGSTGSHFEKRVFNDELMTGSIDHNGIISRFTLALLEDSGWYRPNYEEAMPLKWGKNLGCSFIQEGCLEPLTKRMRVPFCEDLPLSQEASIKLSNLLRMPLLFREEGLGSSCVYDRDAIGICGNGLSLKPVDPYFQYFKSPFIKGLDKMSDRCPYVMQLINCKEQQDQRITINAFAETYGPNSKCVDFRIDSNWVFDKQTIPPVKGGACYEVYCEDSQGPLITISGKNISCTPQQQITIPQKNPPVLVNTVEIICPPCEDLCWDNLKACRTTNEAPLSDSLVYMDNN